MIGVPKGPGLTVTRYAGLGLWGSVKTAAGFVMRSDRKPSGVDDTGGGGGGHTAGASHAAATYLPGSSLTGVVHVEQ